MVEIHTIQWRDDHILMIDQRKLPNEEVYVTCKTYLDVADAIRSMVIRGAPAIGVAAAMGVALGMKQAIGDEVPDLQRKFSDIYESLYATRPTAVNLRWGLERMKKVFEESRSGATAEMLEKLEQMALQIYKDDISINRTMAAHGASLVQAGTEVMTYCNTGTLATAGYGTALGVIRAAHESGKVFGVYVCETRPFLQGLRLTSWELQKLNIPQKVISDNMAAMLMAQNKVSAVFVGADRVAANGDTANKVGTYMLAVLAKYHHIPFYVVAPTSTIDPKSPNGAAIPIEERDPKEITHVGGVAVGLERVGVYNPAFDVTPAHLISAWVTEKGIVRHSSDIAQ